MFARVNIFQLANTLYGAFFQRMTADGIHCIGRINNDAPLFQRVDDALQIVRIIVFVV